MSKVQAKDRVRAEEIIDAIKAKVPLSGFAIPGTTGRVEVKLSDGYGTLKFFDLVELDGVGVEDDYISVYDKDATQLSVTCEILRLLTELAVCLA